MTINHTDIIAVISKALEGVNPSKASSILDGMLAIGKSLEVECLELAEQRDTICSRVAVIQKSKLTSAGNGSVSLTVGITKALASIVKHSKDDESDYESAKLATAQFRTLAKYASLVSYKYECIVNTSAS